MRNLLGSFTACILVTGLSLVACGGSNAGDDDATPGGNGNGTDGGNVTGEGGSGDAGTGTGDDGGRIVTAPPTHAAQAVSFLDVDPDPAKVGGTVFVTKATDESDVQSYEIYGADDTGAKAGSSFIGSVPASGKDVTFTVPDGSAVKAGVTKVVVLTKNAAGEMTTGPVDTYADAVVHKIALKTFYGNASVAGSPKISFDTVNRKLMMISATGIYIHCSLDGSSCTANDITGGHDFATPSRPALDAANGKALVPAATTALRTNGFVIPTTLDGVASTAIDFSDPTVAGSGASPATVVDTVRNRILNVVRVEDTTAGTNTAGQNVLYDCDFNVTCNRRDIGVGASPTVQPPSDGNLPSVAFDPTGQKLYVVSGGPAKANAPPFLLICPTATAGACIGRNDMIVPADDNQIHNATPIIDGAGGKLDLIAAAIGHAPQLYRCNLDGSSCGASIALGSTTLSSASMSAVGDDARHKIVVSGLQQSGAAPALYRCDMDGTNCELASTAAGSQYFYTDVTVDPRTGQAFVVGYGNDGELYLFFMQ